MWSKLIHPANDIDQTMKIWFAFFFVYVIGAFYFSYLWLPKLPDQFRLQSGQVIESSSATPHALTSLDKQTVMLPDWDTPGHLNAKSLWYLIPFNADTVTSQKHAIYLPRVSQNAEVFLNNYWLGNGGSMQSPVSRNRDHNLIFNFDSRILKPQENILAIHLVGESPKRSYLGDVYIGPEQLLKNHASLNKHLHIDLVMVITICLLFTSIFISILWLLRQSDTYYLWYAIFSLLWVFHDYNHFIRNLPIPTALWETLAPMTFGYSMLSIIFFIHRYEGHYSTKIEKILLTYVVALSLPFLNQDLEWIMFYAYHIWSPAIALIGFYALYFILGTYNRTKQDRLIPIFIGGFAIMVFGPHDLLLALQVIPKQSPYMMHFAALLVIVVIGTTLITRFVQSMNVVEHYNRQLQAEVHRNTSDMEYSYRQVQKLMRKYTVAEERQRIMRDIHDGIGGQLVAILASLDSGEVAQTQLKADIKSALQDLRLVIDSLDEESDDLPTLLGMLRMRLSDQFANAKLKLHWKVEDLPRIDNFGPAKVLNTMRIIQEAITNAIKHSDADNLTISTELMSSDGGENYACIIVSDDGCGTLPDEARGRGLLNMQKRADQIGGDLHITANKGTGVSVRLEIPVA